MAAVQQQPSMKKLGKRPELREVDANPTTTNITVNSTSIDVAPAAVVPPLPPASAPQPPAQKEAPPPPQPIQKRVLPLRRRGGGPGIVGSCNIDQLIIDTERRARDTKPAVPLTTTFLLTTNSELVPPPLDASMPAGEASGSYFDKPEVKANYLAQKAIQVPEFWELPKDAVGGKLRARQAEESPETLDAAYIKRHQKYETFEKRQRRREKEKLMHEHYKLKERIDQLKGMDATAFGPAGEARRKEMLEIAEDLEKRYSLLLPHEPRKPNKKKGKKTKAAAANDEMDTEEDFAAEVPASVTKPSNRTGTRSAPPHVSQVPPSPGHKGPAITVAIEAKEGRNGNGRAYMPSDAFQAPAPKNRPRVKSERVEKKPTTKVVDSPHSPALKRNTKRPAASANEEDEVSAADSPVQEEETIPSQGPPKKKQRTDSIRRKSAANGEGPPAHTKSVLLQTAMRRAAQPSARQTSRQVLAFGYTVPQEIMEELYYEIPPWLITQTELEEEHRRRNGSIVSNADPPGMEGRSPPERDEFGFFKSEPRAKSRTPKEEEEEKGTPGPLDIRSPVSDVPGEDVEMNGQGEKDKDLDSTAAQEASQEASQDNVAHTNGVDTQMEDELIDDD